MADATLLTNAPVGAALPERTYGPITRTVLALFAGASGDHNPIHINIDFAKRAGMDDVFAHGMLSMAYLARYVQNFADASALRSWNVRFVAITPVNTSLICSATVASRDAGAVKLALRARTPDGVETLAGEAIISLEEAPGAPA
ncbi:MAG: hypothetical protein JNK94_07955 [Hyphomonadaceae bacterium]|nr:hypothetical protein [Hyphomonadaceae bacterium]MBX3511609.1 hypothetical protein [Hyphomonadaceae bacterium]